MKKLHCSLTTCFMNISFLIFLLILVACGNDTPTTVDPNVTPTATTPKDHIKGTFSITQVTQVSNNLTQAYSNTKVTIAVQSSLLSFTVTNPPATNSVLSTGTATFDGAENLVLTPASGKPINMVLKPISEDGFTSTFTILDSANARRGITGKWVMVFTKDKPES